MTTALTTSLDPARLTPRQIVEELDKYIVGQAAAKRAVAASFGKVTVKPVPRVAAGNMAAPVNGIASRPL